MNNLQIIKDHNLGKHYLYVMKFFIKETLRNNLNHIKFSDYVFENKDYQLLKSIDCIDDIRMLDFIKKHRLFNFLEGDNLFLKYFPNLKGPIKKGSFDSIRSALSLASLSSEIATLFENHDLPMLVIKGIPLSLQTRGLIDKRGGGDLDIFLDSIDLANAMKLLESIGFRRLKVSFPKDINSKIGLYTLWADYQLSFFREYNGFYQCIDLHWALSNVRGDLPNFRDAWNRKEEVFIGENRIYTLSKLDSFHLSCCHAAKDQWGSFRSLIDIHYLADKLSNHQLRSFNKSRVVIWTSKVVYEITRSNKILILANSKIIFNRFVLKKAENAQLLSISVWDKKNGGSLKNYFWIVLRNLFLSSNLLDIIRTISFYIFLPSDFLNSKTREDSGLLIFFNNRFQSFNKILKK